MWPNKEQDTVDRAAAKGAREIIMVTYRETGIATIRQRGADPMAGRSGKEARSVYRGAERTEPDPCRGDSGAIEQGGDAVGMGQERVDH